MNIKKEELLKLYKAATQSGEMNTVIALEELFGKNTFAPSKKTKSIIDKIKTFEDAEEFLGSQHPLVEACNSCMFPGDNCLNAYLKLRVICAALNEGWKPNKESLNFYPEFELLDENDYKYFKEEEVTCIELKGFNTPYDGMRCPLAEFEISQTPSKYGNQLCFKSEKLAKYCGEQFIDLWADFLFTKK